ncbi:MAG: tryptophan--tRNA ligase [Candidatus Niyogibacteria bacterium]|nr:tryptophan--tRNA ligase [Candidatus Niyogibacteria bacterium]
MKKEIVLSGMRPTGELHLGNYFGALKRWAGIQSDHECYWMVADLHSLTTLESTADIEKKTIEMTALWLAAGLDPKKSSVFLQSAIPEHGELASIFATLLPVSMLELNPTYKEMTEAHPRSGSFGLLNYPVLQAADILLYKATRVPVGRDQEPHIEITREIARRFNNRFGEFFAEPHALFEKIPKIYSLKDPTKKMSKSHSPDSYIGLLDDADTVREKIMGAVTDSGNEIVYDPESKPALAHLIELLHLASGQAVEAIEKEYKSAGYANFKKAVAESISGLLSPIQERFRSYKPADVKGVLAEGTAKARTVAQKNLGDIKEKIGLLNLK